MPRKRLSENPESGSPSGEPVYLVVGFLRRPHGVRGELIMDVHTGFPERLRAGTKIFLGDGHTAIKIGTARPHGAGGLLVSFRGLATPEAVGHLRNTWVYVSAADRPPLPEGQVYHHEILGMNVVTDDGRALGTLTEILSTGANDAYVVTSEDKKEILLPAIPDVILNIDAAMREIKVHLLDGLESDR